MDVCVHMQTYTCNLKYSTCLIFRGHSVDCKIESVCVFFIKEQKLSWIMGCPHQLKPLESSSRDFRTPAGFIQYYTDNFWTQSDSAIGYSNLSLKFSVDDFFSLLYSEVKAAGREIGSELLWSMDQFGLWMLI